MYFTTKFEFTAFKKWSVAFFQCGDFDKDNELPWHATSHPNLMSKLDLLQNQVNCYPEKWKMYLKMSP